MSDYFDPDPLTYQEEGFNDYLIRQFDFNRLTQVRQTLAGSPTAISIPGGDFTTPAYEETELDPEVHRIKAQGTMTIGGAVSNGTDLALPNIAIKARRVDLFELTASVKAIGSGTVIFEVKVTRLGHSQSLGFVYVNLADTLAITGIQTKLIYGDMLSVNVTGTHAGVEDATIEVGGTQEAEIV